MKEEYLDLLIEECAEVIQAATKAKRFGLNDSHPTYRNKIPNRTAILLELADVWAVTERLTLTDADYLFMETARNRKHQKLNEFGPDGSYLKRKAGGS